MANNTTLNTMSGGDVIADEDIAGVKYQKVKLVDGTAASTTVIGGDAQGLWTVARRDLQRISVASGGLTTSTTAYAAGDQVATQFTFASAARASGGGGVVVGAVLHDVNDIIGPYDLVLFDASVTLTAGDNGVFAISDADSLHAVGILQLAGAFDIGNNRIAQVYNTALPYICNGSTSLFGGLITRSAHTFFTAVTDLQVDLYVERY